MNRPLPLIASLALTLAPLAASAPTNPSAPKDLVSTAVADGRFTTLAKALEAADLVSALQGEGPFTVFAPTDDAFAALPHGTLEALLDPHAKGRLQSILTYHVVAANLSSRDVLSRPDLDSLNGQRLPISLDDGGVRVAGAGLVLTDIACDNGTIHVIDRVLLPEERSVVQVAQEAGSFGLLLKAAQAAGLAEALTGDGPFTILAPRDSAFQRLGKDALQRLLRPENKAELARILSYHVLPGRVYADDALGLVVANTLEGSPVTFRLENGRLTAAGVRVVANDLQAANGVIHVVERVLTPPAPPAPAAPRGPLVIGYNSEAPGRALAAQLGLDRHASTVVTKVLRQENGLQLYDVIVSVDGEPYTRARLEAAKKRAGFGGTVELRLFRGGAEHVLHAPVSADEH